MSLSLSTRKQGETKKAEPGWLLPCFWTRLGAPVALLQSRTLRTSNNTLPLSPMLPAARGHLYFAKQGTFLFCIDIHCEALFAEADSRLTGKTDLWEIASSHKLLLAKTFADFKKALALGSLRISVMLPHMVVRRKT